MEIFHYFLDLTKKKLETSSATNVFDESISLLWFSQVKKWRWHSYKQRGLSHSELSVSKWMRSCAEWCGTMRYFPFNICVRLKHCIHISFISDGIERRLSRRKYNNKHGFIQIICAVRRDTFDTKSIPLFHLKFLWIYKVLDKDSGEAHSKKPHRLFLMRLNREVIVHGDSHSY